MLTRPLTRSIWRWLALPVVVCVLSNLGGLVRATDRRAADPHSAAGPQRTRIAENAPLPELALLDLTGASRAVRQRSDEVTVLNFWATWCVPCLKELPELVKLSHEGRERGLEVVGIAIDSGRPADIQSFAANHGMDYRLLVGTARWAAEHFGIVGLPVTIVVDRTGRVRRRLIGPQTGPMLATAVQPYLAKEVGRWP